MFARILMLLSLSVTLSVSIDAQQHRSTVRGTVLNPDGSPAANMPMQLLDERTGESRRFASDARGRFTLVQVEPGSYRFVSEDGGFRDFIARAFVKQHEDIDVTLPLGMGSISADVDYRSFALGVERDIATLRTRLPGSFLTDLPLDGRSFLDVLALAPRFSPHPAGPRAAGVLTSNYWLDGFANVSTVGHPPILFTQLESIDHFEAAVPVFHTDFWGAGGDISVLTRSGTNRFSGGAFGFAQTAADRQQLGGFAGGPVVADRTFVFGDLQYTRFSDSLPMRNNGMDGGVRLDHVLGDGARLTARYAISDGVFFERRGQLFGAALRHGFGPGVNDVRFTIADRSAVVMPGAPVPRVYGLADTFAWASGDHALKGGVEWQHADLEFLAGGTGQIFSTYLQDDWRPGSQLSVQGGFRIDWLRPPDAVGDDATHVLPRVGIAWEPVPGIGTVLRGGYGRFAEHSTLFPAVDAIDQWTLGVARQWGRTRTIEVAYEGTRVPDFGRHNALIIEMEQRSEVGVTGHLAYRFGDLDRESNLPDDDEDDPRHKLTGAFVWWLPLGDERLLLSDGVLAKIFGEMQLTGVLVMEGIRTDPQTGGRGNFRTLDLGILKNLRIADRTLQLRFETFNTLNRANERPFFYPDLLSVPVAGNSGRRYQVGLRYLF